MMDNDSSSAGAAAALGRWWGQSPQPSPSTDVMNQLCRVCGEPAAGFHFGAFTCEGCKSFFGRTYNNLGSITECKNNGECVINKKNRTACKACRLRKCLLVGMSKSGSRYGRRSNWFKIHCLLQEQQQAAGAAPHLKDKSALAIWGESYKNLPAPPPHLDSDSKGSPTEESIPLNNNTLTKDPDRSHNPSTLPNHSAPFPPDAAAAALWAARHSLFPMHLPHHHALPALPLPFLPSFPSFPPPPSGHSAPQRNLLLPFMHNFHTHSPHSPNSPHSNHQPTTASASPSRSRSRSPSICSHSPSPVPSSPRTPPPSVKTVHDTLSQPKHRSDRNKMAEEHSLALLRSLGPMQETPMDLSVRVMEVKHRGSRRKSKTSQRVRGEGERVGETGRDEGDGTEGGSESEGSESEVIVREMKDGLSDVLDNNDENFNKRKTPLDLTKSTKVEI